MRCFSLTHRTHSTSLDFWTSARREWCSAVDDSNVPSRPEYNCGLCSIGNVFLWRNWGITIIKARSITDEQHVEVQHWIRDEHLMQGHVIIQSWVPEYGMRGYPAARELDIEPSRRSRARQLGSDRRVRNARGAETLVPRSHRLQRSLVNGLESFHVPDT